MSWTVCLKACYIMITKATCIWYRCCKSIHPPEGSKGGIIFLCCRVTSNYFCSLKLLILKWLTCPFFCLPNREDVERRFEGKLSKNMSGPLYEMVSRVMKALVNHKITVPGNFQGYIPHAYIQNTFSYFIWLSKSG